MANLKGSTFEKQIRDALIRLDARGTKRIGDARFDGLAHSHAVLEKRKQILENFAQFLYGKGFSEKLNNAMIPKTIAQFLQERTAMMALVTIENYIANFSALIKALRLKNITINENIDYEFFQREKDKLGRPDTNAFQTGRYMDEDAVQEMLNRLPHRSRVVAIIQYKLCFRASEALLITNNPDKHLLGLTISKVKGKGGQVYPEKTVDTDTANIIRSAKPISRSTYYRDQRKALQGKNRPHDLRLSHICDLYDSLRNAGEPHEQSMLKASKASNHHRPSTTGGYQARC